MASSKTALLPGTVIADRFVVKRMIAAGGMATVVVAEDTRLRRLVAIKILQGDLGRDEAIVRRFLLEARAVVSLRSEHVVTVLDVGTLSDGLPYMVMEFLDGLSLREYLAKRGPMQLTLALEYVLQTLEAIAEAHRAGIVHRDLKPENLMVAHHEDGSPRVKVIDFGISKRTQATTTSNNLTVRNAFLGSPCYASPEQFRDSAHVDERTDIWSIGVILYELLSGRPPFAAHSPNALVTAICTQQPTSLLQLRPDLPPELGPTIGRCLAKHPDERFANAEQLALALAPFATSLASQVSIERILGGRTSAPPRVSRPRVPSVSAPPVWSSATQAPAREDARKTRISPRGAFALGGLAAVALVLSVVWLQSAKPVPALVRADDAHGASASAFPTPSISQVLPAAAEATISAAQPQEMSTFSSSPRALSGARHVVSLPSANSVGGQPSQALPSREPVAARPPLIHPLRARPLDTANPFNP